jgi:hypothetical protein
MSAAALGEGLAQAALAPTFVVSSTKAAMLIVARQGDKKCTPFGFRIGVGQAR